MADDLFDALSDPADLLTIWVEETGMVVVHVVGEVDIATAPKLLSALQSAVAGDGSAPPEVVVDLAEMTFIDARGLGALVGAARMASQTAGALSLAHPSAMVRKLLTLTGLQDVLPVLPEV